MDCLNIFIRTTFTVLISRSRIFSEPFFVSLSCRTTENRRKFLRVSFLKMGVINGRHCEAFKVQMKCFFIAEFERAAKIRKIAVYRFLISLLDPEL